MLRGGDYLSGGAGDDQLFGGVDSDLLQGGKGVDSLVGGVDIDTYLFDLGDDSEFHGLTVITDIVESNGIGNVVRFGEGIVAGDISLHAQNGDLRVQYSASDEFLVKKGVTEKVINTFEFADGSTYTLQQLWDASNADSIYAYVAGSGQKSIADSRGVDTVLFGPGIDVESLSARVENATSSIALQGAELLVGSQAGVNQNRPMIIELASGGYVVTWVDEGSEAGNTNRYNDKRLYQVFNSDGVGENWIRENYSIPVEVVDGGSFAEGYALLSNDFNSSTGLLTLKLHAIDAAGLTHSEAIPTSSFRSSEMTTGNDSLVVAWLVDEGVNGSHIQARIYSDGGAYQAVEIARTLVDQEAITSFSLASLSNGGFAVNIEKNNAIDVQVFDVLGLPLGAAVNLVAEAPYGLDEAGVVGLADGGFASFYTLQGAIVGQVQSLGLLLRLPETPYTIERVSPRWMMVVFMLFG